jgi:hypothetical protein
MLVARAFQKAVERQEATRRARGRFLRADFLQTQDIRRERVQQRPQHAEPPREGALMRGRPVEVFEV